MSVVVAERGHTREGVEGAGNKLSAVRVTVETQVSVKRANTDGVPDRSKTYENTRQKTPFWGPNERVLWKLNYR